jgi:hypothetical protein
MRLCVRGPYGPLTSQIHCAHTQCSAAAANLQTPSRPHVSCSGASTQGATGLVMYVERRNGKRDTQGTYREQTQSVARRKNRILLLSVSS